MNVNYSKLFVNVSDVRETVIKSNYSFNHEIALRNNKFSSEFLESDSQGFRSKFLYHENQRHSLNQKHFFDYKKFSHEIELFLRSNPKS